MSVPDKEAFSMLARSSRHVNKVAIIFISQQ